jgi:hypothetical protein
MADDRPIVYEENGVWVYRASSVGVSIRELVAARLGYPPLPPPEYLRKAAAAGNRYESIVKSRLGERGWIIDSEQPTIEIPIEGGTGPLLIRGHLDGDRVQVNGYPLAMLEVKSMSARVWERWHVEGFAGFGTYAAQIAAYMHGTGRPAWYVVVNRDDDDVELDIQFLEEPPVSWYEVMGRVLLSDHYAAQGELPPCDRPSPYTCPYDHLCDHRLPLFAELESGEEETIARLAAEYEEARRIKGEVESNIKGIQEEIRLTLGDRDAVEAGGWKVTDREVERASIDKVRLAQFLKEHGHRIEDFEKKSSFRRMTVSGGPST